MLRAEWKFQYNAGRLADAAKTKMDHHNSRKAWWKDQQDTVIAEVREKGLEVSEPIAMQYGSTAVISRHLAGNAVGGAQIVVKSEYQEKLNECATKIQSHSTKAEEYAGWVQLLQANPNNALDLDIHDYLFFFGE